jgi:hemolysin activation/secretion protein
MMRRVQVSQVSLAAAISVLVLVPSLAFAQSVPQAPPLLQANPLEHIAPQTTPNLGAGLPTFGATGTEGALPTANISVGTVTVVGATAFTPAQLNAVTAGLAGTSAPLDKIEAARRSLVALYRRHGFVLSTVSMDIDRQGDVRYIVTEGHIVAVKLSQDIGPAGTMVLAFLNHLTTERPVSEASLERWLLLAQQVPGVSVHAVLQADSDDPGSLTLIADVARQAESGLVTADDRSFKETGPAEVLAVGDINSVSSIGDQTEISLFHTSGSTDNFAQASESWFIGSRGLRAKIYAGEGRADPGGTLREVDYASRLEVFGALLAYPALLTRNQALNVSLKFDATQNLILTSHVKSSFDSLRMFRANAQYAWQDLWLGYARSGVSVLNVQLSKGVTALGASPDGRPLGEAGRETEKIDFAKFNGSVARTQTLFSPGAESTIALRLEAGGQYSTDILPASEQFDLGGSRFTRGYYSGQVAGDKAVYGTAELQFNSGTNFNILSLPIDFGTQLYSFYDFGETWSNLTTDAPHRLASAGVGVRLGVTRYLEIDGEFDKRLTTRLDAQNTTELPLSGSVIYWGVTARY